MERRGNLLDEAADILRDYQQRIDRIGPEAFRLRGESFAAWESKRVRITVVAGLLEARVGAQGIDATMRELAQAPPVPLPPEYTRRAGALAAVLEASNTMLREHLAQLHRQHPRMCEGERCACRPEGLEAVMRPEPPEAA